MVVVNPAPSADLVQQGIREAGGQSLQQTVFDDSFQIVNPALSLIGMLNPFHFAQQPGILRHCKTTSQSRTDLDRTEAVERQISITSLAFVGTCEGLMLVFDQHQSVLLRKIDERGHVETAAKQMGHH